MSTEVSRAPLEEEVQPVQVPRVVRDVEVVWIVSVQQSVRVPYQRAHPEYPHQAEQKRGHGEDSDLWYGKCPEPSSKTLYGIKKRNS